MKFESTSIYEQVIDLVVKQIRGVSREQLRAQTSFVNDLGADSLDVVELVMEFEHKFDIHIPDEDAEKIQTVKQAVTCIEEHIPQNP